MVKELHKNSECFTAAFSCVSDGVIITDIEGIVIYVNNSFEKLVELNEAVLIGKKIENILQIYSEKGNEYSEKSLRETIVKRKNVLIDNNSYIITKNSKTKFISVSFSPIMKEDIFVTGTIIIIRDITKDKLVEENILNEKNNILNRFNQVPVLIWQTDLNMETVNVNRAWDEFLGENEVNVSIKKNDLVNLIHPDDMQKFLELRLWVLDNRQSIQSEFRLKNYEGEFVWCLVVGGPYFDLNGNLSGYIGSIYDINERKTLENELNRYRQFFFNAKEIMFFLDKKGNIIEANKAAIMTYGYTKDELYKMNMKQIRSNWNFSKDDFEKMDSTGLFFEVVHYRKDGTSFPVEVSSQGTNFGNKYVIFNIIRDISERKYQEEMVQDNQIKYRTLFMNLKNGLVYQKIIFNEHNNICNLEFVEVNEAFLKFFSLSDDISGEKCTKIFPSMGKILIEKIKKYYSKLLNGEIIELDEYYYVKRKKWFKINIYSPRVNDVVLIFSDISHIKDTEKKLIEQKNIAETANKAKSEFLANMSHEIRTPINGILGMIDLTLLTTLNGEQKDNLVTAKICADSLINIINDILDFSKMEAGKITIEYVNFNIKNVIDEIIKTHSTRASSKNIELNYMFPSNIPEYLIGDPNRLRQILNNLISNAIKFTNDGNVTLIIKIIEQKNNFVELRFIVKDTGIGISDDEKKKLFQSFSQLENSFTKTHGGTGLGLVISKNLIELMGGEIDVESKKGKGSSFYFSLKFKIGKNDKKIFNYKPDISKTTFTKNILLVEDDLVNQKVIKKMLLEKGHIVDTASDGLEALDLFISYKYDVILMDIQMPKLDGVETNKQIRKIETNKGFEHTPIIALTAYALHGDREKFLSLGFDDYIPKPIQMSVLFDILDNISTYDEKSEEDFKILFENIKSDLKPEEVNQKIQIIENDMIDLEKSLEHGNAVHIEHIAHEIKVNAIEIEAVDLKNTTFKLELLARKGEMENMEKYFEQMKRDLKIFKEYLIN